MEEEKKNINRKKLIIGVLIGIICFLILVFVFINYNKSILKNEANNNDKNTINDTSNENNEVDEVDINLSIKNVEVSKDAPNSKISVTGTINLSYDTNKYKGITLSGYCLGTSGEKYLISGPNDGRVLFHNDGNNNLTLGENIPQNIVYSDGTSKSWDEIDWSNVKIKYCKIDKMTAVLNEGTNSPQFELNFEKYFSDNSIEKEDYSGKYKKNGSEITINKNGDGYNVEIVIFRLGNFKGKVTNISNNKLTIVATAEKESDLEFVFDNNTKILTVTKSSWNLLSSGNSYQFGDNNELSQASNEIAIELKSRRFLAKNSIDINSKTKFMKVSDNLYFIEVQYNNINNQELITDFLVTYKEGKVIFNKYEEGKNKYNKYIDVKNYILKNEIIMKELDNIIFYNISNGTFNEMEKFSKSVNKNLKYVYNSKEVSESEYKSKYSNYEKYSFIKFEDNAVELNDENIDKIVK